MSKKTNLLWIGAVAASAVAVGVGYVLKKKSQGESLCSNTSEWILNAEEKLRALDQKLNAHAKSAQTQSAG